MPHYIPPDYLDNTPGRNLADALGRLITDWDQRDLAVATGFFEPDAWRHVGDAFRRLDRFRLLLGKAPELEGRVDDTVDLRAYYRRKLQGDLEALPFDPEYAALVDGLAAFLGGDQVAVRLFRSFLHAKAYLFSDVAIVGSSNLTAAGLNRKAELNMVRKEQAVAQALRNEWFEGFWAEAEDYKADLIAALQASKFGATPYTPFQVFIKALYEYFKERLSADAPEAYIGVDLATFQQEGLREAIRLLDRYHGVIVADAVGLGKTYIGMGLLEHYVLRARRKGFIPRGLIVCPAQLRDLVWAPKLDQYGIKATLCSMEEMGRNDCDWKQFNGYDFVLVDESHNFRNPGTGRYGNLNKLICTGKRDKFVVLMTATPINNTIWDLYHQIMLLARGSDSYYRDEGVPNLIGFFKRVQGGTAELFDLLEATTVRRSRHDIKKRQEAGEKVILPGKGEIHFPDRELRSIEYNLEQTYRGLYQEIADQIERLTLVSYNVEQFHKHADRDAVERNNALIGIIKTTLLKRLESSLRAFQVSVERQRRYQRRFFELLQQGRLLDAPHYRKIIALEEESDGSEAVEAVDALIDALPEVPADKYDMDAIREELESDLRIFDDLLAWIDIVAGGPGGAATEDAKLAAVKAELSGPLRGHKVLIFSYFQDTAHYLYDSLRADAAWAARAGQPEIGLIVGSTPPQERESLVKRFAPNANTAQGDEGVRERQTLRGHELQVLISTDVLSEGQNLQDAGAMINYDLHWNPVRMIQRAGRIDRLGSPYDSLLIYNCFPEQGLESLLHLVEKLQKRIAAIDQAVGLDASVLGEVIHPKSLEDLKRIKAGERTVLDELEQTAELISTDEMKLPLILYLQSLGAERLREIPLGIHSGRRSTEAGTFLAFKVRDRHFWRFYPAAGGEPVTDKRRIFALLQCAPTENRVLPEHNIFPLIEQATAEILRELKATRSVHKIHPQMAPLNRRLYDALNQARLFEEQSSEELRARVSRVLQNVSLQPFQRDRTLHAMDAAARAGGSAQALAEQLDAFFVDNDLYRDVIEPTVLEQIGREDLRLVCYEILTA